jgi:hypothetical protein
VDEFPVADLSRLLLDNPANMMNELASQQKDAWIEQNLGWKTTVIRMNQACPAGC